MSGKMSDGHRQPDRGHGIYCAIIVSHGDYSLVQGIVLPFMLAVHT